MFLTIIKNITIIKILITSLKRYLITILFNKQLLNM